MLHRAISYKEFGEPSKVLSLTKVRCPALAPHEVLVRMDLCSINPSDLITIRGTYSNRVSLPNIAGFEGVGVIADVGINVKHLSVGSRVLALRGQGTWQEYVVVPASEAVLVPDDINDQTAAQLYINPLTAWLMLKEKLKVRVEDTLALNAGNSAFGYVMAAFSQFLKIDAIFIVRRPSCVEALKKAGAKLVINTSETNLKTAIADYTNGIGVKFALDAVGGEGGAQLAECVQNNGTMLHYGLLSGTPLSPDVYLKSAARNVVIENYFLRDWVCSKEVTCRQSVFRSMIDVLSKLNIHLPVEREYLLEEIAQAVNHAEMPGRKGKILLRAN